MSNQSNPPTPRPDALRGKRVTIMGLGLNRGGLAAARFFVSHGAAVTVTDLRDETVLAASLEALHALPITYALGGHQKRHFAETDLVVKNPGVPLTSPFIHIAQQRHIPVTGDVAYFLEHTSAFTVGVTGTKGKTTTATLIAEGFSALKMKPLLLSTPDAAIFDSFDSVRHDSVVVLELSSFDLEFLPIVAISPPIAVITSFFDDHLAWHGGREHYAAAKQNIFRFQHKEDRVIIPVDDDTVAQLAQGAGARLVFAKPLDNEIRLAGTHNRQNAGIALTTIGEAIAHPRFPKRPDAHNAADKAEKAIRSFPGVHDRFDRIGETEGRYGINDTAATNPGAAIAGLAATARPIVLICGGDAKGLVYDALADAITKRVKRVILLPGNASEMLQTLLSERGFSSIISGIMDMEGAVAAAFAASETGDTILLSPGASSLNAFANEFDRGEQFVRAFLGYQHTTL